MIYELLIESEISEAKFKHARLLQHLKRQDQTLSVHRLEKSVVTFCAQEEPAFKIFNFARVQETSPEGIAEIVEFITKNTKSHSLATLPLGLSDAAYMKLHELGYKMFHNRSILHLEVPNTRADYDLSEIKICTGSSPQNLSDALAVLNSFQPTSENDFEKSYTYWLRDNEKAELSVASIGGKPVALGILNGVGPVGLLSSGVVDPAYRGKGIQKLLIKYRIHRANELGLKSLFAPGVPPFSASETSLKRCGFALLCNRLFWKK